MSLVLGRKVLAVPYGAFVAPVLKFDRGWYAMMILFARLTTTDTPRLTLLKLPQSYRSSAVLRGTNIPSDHIFPS